MKRNLLALAIPALLVAGAANASIEIYNKDGNKLSINGQAEVVNYIGADTKNAKNGDDSNAKLGFTGETQITDSITGYGRAEWETNTSDSASINTRYAYAGLDFGTAGAFDYGKNDGVLKAITSYTDVLPKFGGDASSDAYLLSQRQQAVATYRNAKLVDGLSIAVQYADSSTAETTNSIIELDGNGNPTGRVVDKTTSHKVAEAYGLNAQYTIADTGVTVGAGYAQAAKLKDMKESTYMLGANYDANDLYLAAIYAYGEEKNSVSGYKSKTKGYELVAQYSIGLDVGTVKPSLAYVQHTNKETKYTNATTIKSKVAKYVSVGASYEFNKNLTFVAAYKINLLKKDDVRSTSEYKNSLGLGLSYQF